MGDKEGNTPGVGDEGWEESQVRKYKGCVGVHVLCQHACTTVFDVRVTGTDAPTYQGMSPHKVLVHHKKYNKAE